MSNITIKEEESQAQNQKTTPVMEPSSEHNNSNTNLLDSLFLTWLGRRDSNPRMLGPEPSALPLGDSPIIWASHSITERRLLLQHIFDVQVIVPECPERIEVETEPDKIKRYDVPSA